MIYELRHYIAAEGKADALARRFADHVFPLFAKHGLQLVDYWETANADREIWYVMAWDSKDAMAAGWARFRDDPGWTAAKAATEIDGPLSGTTRSIVLERPAYYRP